MIEARPGMKPIKGIPSDGEWTMASFHGHVIVADKSGKYPPYEIDARGNATAVASPSLQSVRPKDGA